MDTRVGKYLEERPLGHSLVKVSELRAWSEAERLPYDFQQIIGDFQFVQAEFLFPIVSDWSTQHLTPEAAQGIMAKRGTIMGGHLIADDPSTSMWSVTAGAHNAFERLFYQAVMNGALRLLDGITRMPIKGLPPESLARFAEVGGDADNPASGKVEAVPVTQDGEPPMRPGKNSREAVEAWVAWQSRDKVEDGDNVSDIAQKIYLIAEKWGYQSERQKEGEKISIANITKMIPAKLTGGRAKNTGKPKK